MTVEHEKWCASHLTNFQNMECACSCGAETRQIRTTILSAITDLERLNEVLSAGIADQVRVREIIEKLKGAVE